MSKVETLACPDDELGHEEEINKHDKEELESDEEVFLNESQLENSVLKNNQNEELFLTILLLGVAKLYRLTQF